MLCNAAVIVPVLSWIEETRGAETSYAGSLGQLVGLDPRKNDRVDPFLVQIVVANALLGLPTQRKAIKSVFPIFSYLEIRNNKTSPDNYTYMLQLLSNDPSIESNQEAADMLSKNRFPVTSGILQRSIRENVARLFDIIDDEKHCQR